MDLALRLANRSAAVALALSPIAGTSQAADRASPPTWDAAGAAGYLDRRLDWWRSWPKAERDGCAASPAIAPNAEALRGYLRTAFAKDGSLFTRMNVLWADSHLHGGPGGWRTSSVPWCAPKLEFHPCVILLPPLY